MSRELDLVSAMADFNPPQYRVVRGPLAGSIDLAEGCYNSTFTRSHGVAPPESLPFSCYTKTELQRQNEAEVLKDTRQIVSSTGLVTPWQKESVRIRNASFDAVYDDSLLTDSLKLSIDPDRLLQTGYTGNNGVINLSTMCVLSVFQMLASGVDRSGDYDSMKTKVIYDSLVNLIDEVLPHDPVRLFDLLGSIATSGSVRHVISIGAGLPYIQEKIIDPVLNKMPNVSVGVAILAQSSSRQAANHAYSVSGIDSRGNVLLNDPKFGKDQSVSAEEVCSPLVSFQKRWFRANLQTHVIFCG